MKVRAVLVAGVISAGAASVASAEGPHRIGTNLIGYEEVPAVSTTGRGEFDAVISGEGKTRSITYELSYRDMEAEVLQAHIHFGQRSVNGGISVFLCTNLGNGPEGTQACPPSPATIRGEIDSKDVIGPGAQGITAAELEELVGAIRAGVAYVNVHTRTFPGGEIRGQLDAGHSHGPKD